MMVYFSLNAVKYLEEVGYQLPFTQNVQQLNLFKSVVRPLAYASGRAQLMMSCPQSTSVNDSVHLR
jgi:hypothetical protein